MNFLKSVLGGGSGSMIAADAKVRIEGENPPYVLDVRQPSEFASGHIPGAVLIPLDQLAARMSELPKDREILCVCRSGARSGSATRTLQSAGYQAVNLSGGMIAWQGAGFPVKKGS